MNENLDYNMKSVAVSPFKVFFLQENLENQATSIMVCLSQLN